MKILAVFGRHAYGDPARGESYEHANILPDLRDIAGADEVALFDCWDRSAYASYAEMNRALVASVAAFEPDVIFLVLMGYEIWTETLDLVAAQSPAALIHWGTDDSWKYAQFTRFIAPHVHLHVTTDAAALEQSQRDGLANVALSQWAACGAKLASPLPAEACMHDVTFIGAAYGNRPAWVAALSQRGVGVTCYGKGWDTGVVSSVDMARIYRHSRISLNFADSGLQMTGGKIQRSRQIKARTFEVPGAGGFLLTEPAEGLGEYFDIGREMVTYADADDLAAKVRHYLAQPGERDAMARLAHARVAAEHTYRARLPGLIGRAREHAAARQPARAWRLDPAVLAPAVARHGRGAVLRAAGAGLTRIATLGLGADRGPRAARRLVHEASWRVAGARTYSAAGLPGRMFYDAP